MKNALVVSTAAAFLVACALGSAEPTEASYTPLRYCNARAESECASEVLGRCAIKSRAECVHARAADCVGRSPQGASVRAALVGECLATITKAYGDAKLTADELRDVRHDCDDTLWSGPGEVKAACTVDSDCDTNEGLRCLVPLGYPGEVKGTCLRPHVVRAGGACDGPADACEKGTYCDGSSATCLVRRSEGEQCHEWLAPCVEGMSCPGSTSPFASAKCTPRLPAGAPCAKDADCADDICLRIAKTAAGTCVSEVTLSPVDSICATFKAQ